MCPEVDVFSQSANFSFLCADGFSHMFDHPVPFLPHHIGTGDLEAGKEETEERARTASMNKETKYILGVLVVTTCIVISEYLVQKHVCWKKNH